MDEATLQELKAQHGEVYTITAEDHTIVVKMPTPAQFERFSDSAEKKPLRAMTTLLRDCCVHPARPELDAMFAARPGLPVAFGKQMATISGATLEADAKKA